MHLFVVGRAESGARQPQRAHATTGGDVGAGARGLGGEGRDDSDISQRDHRIKAVATCLLQTIMACIV